MSGVKEVMRSTRLRPRASSDRQPPSRVISLARTYRVWLILVLLGLVATAASKGVFARGSNLVDILFLAAPVGIAALGETMVIITAGIDLSTAAVWALASMVGGTLAVHGANVGVAVVAALAVGLAAGLVNGVLVGYLRIPPLITTLGMLGIAEGTAETFSNNQSILSLPTAYTQLGGSSLGPIPLMVLIWVVIAIGMAFLMGRTTVGKSVYALGGSPSAARYSGLRVKGTLVTIYAIAGVLSALAGVLSSAYINIATPTSDTTTLFDVIAAAVVGGANLFGGEGNVINSLAGVLVIVVIQNLLNILGVSPLLQQGVLGAVIFVAVLVNVLAGGTRGQVRIRHKGV